ncbi:hypothetical protein Pfo_031056 [Paulownia fortunei]|nr:hypothetical protein Pfo_031056 [Paulownia fortunei]
MKPLVLVAPVPERPLILYITAQDRSVGALLAQENNDGKENALYYLSRMMTLNELNYSPIEKICLALIFAIQKLKHYFQAHIVHLVSKANPLKYIMYVPQKIVKGQVLADFLADHPIPAEWELSDDLLNEDAGGSGAGVVFIISDGEVLPYSFTLTQNCSNNVAEYQALILGLKMAIDINQLHPEIYGDSKLIVNQLLGLYELGDVVIDHVPRKDNEQADALANLASTLVVSEGEIRVPICRSWVVPPIFEDESCDEEKENHAQRKSSMYYVVVNSLAEAFNKTLCNLLKKVIAKITYRMPTQATPYALVYGVEAIIPLEQQIPSRIGIQEELTEEENTHLCLEELEALDEKRLEAQQRLEYYQARLSRVFNKKVRSRSFQVGNLVLAVRRPIITTHRTGNKFTSKWDGLYVVKEVYTNGAYKLVVEDGLRIGLINGKFLKCYYA